LLYAISAISLTESGAMITKNVHGLPAR
jgi:hypothetical protein